MVGLSLVGSQLAVGSSYGVAASAAVPPTSLPSENPFEYLRESTLGLQTLYPVVDPDLTQFVLDSMVVVSGNRVPLTYLDSTASTKLIGPVAEARGRLDEAYANSHSVTHPPARISTHYYKAAHRIALEFVNANPLTHTAVFVGTGATGPINRVARNLFVHRPDSKRDVVLFSGREHHANQLPWQKYAGDRNCFGIPLDPVTGKVDMAAYKELLGEHGDRIRLVAINGVSNVTGVVEPNIPLMADLAHEVGAQLLVDHAQGLAHLPVNMQNEGIDFLVASGHKVYAPGSPGLLIMPRDTSPSRPDEMGGGIVLSVNIDSFLLSNKLPDREEAGTPNIYGAVMLATALRTLDWVGMNRVWEHERVLTEMLIEGLLALDDVKIYGDTDLQRTPRAGVVTFTVDGMHHAVLSQALSDYFAIATRNECFCAHPYVKSLLGMTPEQLQAFEHDVAEGDHSTTPGMVRASLGIYNNKQDIRSLLAAMSWVVANKKRLLDEYGVNRDGQAIRKDGWQVNPVDYLVIPFTPRNSPAD